MVHMDSAKPAFHLLRKRESHLLSARNKSWLAKKVHSMGMSEYFADLSEEAKARYKAKLEIISLTYEDKP